MTTSLRFVSCFFLLVLSSFSVAEEECGDGYYCSYDGVYGCAKLPMGHDNPLVCCSAGEPESGCVHAGHGKPLPHCPANGATGQGCSRLDEKKSSNASRPQSQDSLEGEYEEECGPGYTCVAKQAYGCAKMPVDGRNFTMVCCSIGMPKEACAESSSTSSPLPYCPAGGATGSGCIRARSRHGANDSSERSRKTRPVEIN